MATKIAFSSERRVSRRYPTTTKVYLCLAGKDPKPYYAENLSATGVFIRTDELNVASGTKVNMTFLVQLNSLIKMYRRRGVAIHTFKGGTGFVMVRFTPEIV